MKKLLFAGASLLAVTPAFADGDLNVYIDHDKDIQIYERIAIAKLVVANADIFIDAEKFAESYALINQNNFANLACSNCAEKQDYIFDSFNNSTGQIGANQASGNQNNQGNAISIAYDFTPQFVPPTHNDDPETPNGTPGGFAESQAAVSQNNGVVFRRPDEGSAADINGGPPTVLNTEATSGAFGSYSSNFLELASSQTTLDTLRNIAVDGGTQGRTILPGNPFLFRNTVKTVNVLFRNAAVADSFSNNAGVLHANQSAGNMNNQANALSMAVSLEDNGVALSEADLGQYTVFNDVQESDNGDEGITGTRPGIRKLSSIDNSFNGNTGIVGFNQTTGNMANQANVVSLSAVNTGAGTTVAGAF